MSSLREEEFDLFFQTLTNPPAEWLRRGGRRRADSMRSPMTKPMGDAGIVVIAGALKSLLKWMHRHGYAHLRFSRSSSVCVEAEVYAKRVGRKLPDSMRLAEWHHVCWVLDTNCTLELRACFELMYFCELRLAEVCELTWGDLCAPTAEFQAWQVLVRARGGRSRRLLIADPAGATLRELQSQVACLSPPLFHGRVLGFNTAETLGYHVKAIIMRAAQRALDKGDLESHKALGRRGVRSLRKAYGSHVPFEWQERWSYCREGIASTAIIHRDSQSGDVNASSPRGLEAHSSLQELWARLRPGWEQAKESSSPKMRE
ncbi:hypothetical protein QTI17_29260 [Variovorax sp. J31P179]|uniref:hypothetical protein n=1 Tax=Variovorax sp. J31P179 TaxID=3053508 RepID=UPI0025791240|nr:hypothetical protein [Variovorax sp. J31P179]MDM0084696.1 hypothetical protein [Variovorax sp. J31P179]